MGWSMLNLLSTIGSFVLAVGILLIVRRTSLWSLVARRSRPATTRGVANTLEWSTTLAAAALQLRRDPGRPQRESELGRRRPRRGPSAPERGELVLADGHETVATSEVDGDLERACCGCPRDSPWPLAVAAALTVFFVGLIARSNVAAWIGVALILRDARRLALPLGAGEEELA